MARLSTHYDITVLSGSRTFSSSSAWCCLILHGNDTSSSLVQPPAVRTAHAHDDSYSVHTRQQRCVTIHPWYILYSSSVATCPLCPVRNRTVRYFGDLKNKAPTGQAFSGIFVPINILSFLATTCRFSACLTCLFSPRTLNIQNDWLLHISNSAQCRAVVVFSNQCIGVNPSARADLRILSFLLTYGASLAVLIIIIIIIIIIASIARTNSHCSYVFDFCF